MGRVRGPGGLLWKNVGVWWGWGDCYFSASLLEVGAGL